jgi:serine/threonine protein kinase
VGLPCYGAACRAHFYCFIPEEHFKAAEAGILHRDHLIGKKLDDYLVVRRLGAGGFGTVYLALQMPILMQTALKLLRTQASDSEAIEAEDSKFRREAQALAKLNHPNIVRLIKYGTFERVPYIVMEYVEGGRELSRVIRERFSSGKGFELWEVRHIAIQILHALGAAHEKDVVHRDIKPQNVMLQDVMGDPLFVRVLDFGLAKFVEESPKTTAVQGTPLYMAPEQFRGKELGPWTDLYATALLTLELLVGRSVFSPSNSDYLTAMKTDPDFDVTRELAGDNLPDFAIAFFRHATAADSAKRIRSVPEFLAGLEAVFANYEAAGITSARPVHLQVASTAERGLSAQPTVVSSPSFGYEDTVASEDPLVAARRKTPTAPKPARKWWKPVVAGVAALLVAAGVVGGWKYLPFFGGKEEVLVHEETRGNQASPSLAVLPDGGFLAVWVSNHEDGATNHVYGRRFKADLSPTGATFRVSTHEQGDRKVPLAVAFPDGRALVFWHSDGQDGSGWGLYGQWYDRNGDRFRSEFLLNDGYTKDVQGMPAAALFDNQDFVVTWHSGGQDGDDFGIVARLYRADGSPEGAELIVNQQTKGRQRFPTAATLPDGRFLVAWESDSAQEKDPYGIQAQILERDGRRANAAFQVNSHVEGRQRYPAAFRTTDGRIVVAWTGEEQDGSGRGIFGQVLAADGSRIGQEFQANTTAAGDQWLPQGEALSDGRFVLAWMSHGQDGAGFASVARVFDPEGNPAGSETQLNEFTAGDQRVRGLANLGGNRLLAVWESEGQDGDGWGVYVRLLSADGMARR